VAEHAKKRKGEKMKKTISYDKEHDILFIHKGFSQDEKFKGNINVGDLVLDMSTRGQVRGVEILNATRFLKELAMERKILQNLTSADFEARTTPDSIIISLFLKAQQEEATAKIAVSMAN
jgi:uncharacterized protein YuzE